VSVWTISKDIWIDSLIKKRQRSICFKNAIRWAGFFYCETS
jgi:hypothetical protein